MQAKDELMAMGLQPRTWAEASAEAREKLAPGDRATFLRLHRAYVEYLSPDTINRFHGFVFSHGIQFEINSFRFHRLEGVLETLLPLLTPGLSILDVGAGAGIIATLVVKHAHPRIYVTQDPCREVRDYLQSMGFTVLPHPPPPAPPTGPFDRLLCVDSLGELNSDEDGAALEPDRTPSERIRLIEQAYGFGQKLEGWKPYLAEGGKVLIWEPIRHRQVWEAMAGHLRDHGWIPVLHGDSPRNTYLELTTA